MRICILLLAATWSLATSDAAAGQGTRAFGGVTYPVPAGWTPVASDGFAALNSPGLEGRPRFVVLPSEATAAAVEDWLPGAVRDWLAADGFGTPDVIGARAVEAGGRPAWAVVVEAERSLSTRTSFVVGLRSGERLYALALQVRALDALSAHAPAFDRWVAALQFGGPGPVVGARPGPLDGVYLSLRVDVLNGGTTAEALTLSRDGWLARTVPAVPLDAFDPDALAVRSPELVGTYRLGDGALTLSLADGTAEALPFERDGPDLVLDGARYTRLRPASAADVVGDWLDGSYFAADGGGGVVASSTERRFGFDAGGRFRASESSFASASTVGGVVSAERRPGATGGAYRAERGALTLRPDSGPPTTVSVYVFGSEGLVIAGDVYYRRD